MPVSGYWALTKARANLVVPFSGWLPAKNFAGRHQEEGGKGPGVVAGLVTQPVNPVTGWPRPRSGAGRWARKTVHPQQTGGNPWEQGRGVQSSGRSGGSLLPFLLSASSPTGRGGHSKGVSSGPRVPCWCCLRFVSEDKSYTLIISLSGLRSCNQAEPLVKTSKRT